VAEVLDQSVTNDPESVEDANDELSTPSEVNELAAADRKSGSVSFEYMVAFAEPVDVDGLESELEELDEDESH
jgi:hypothetical protein